jgi:hypothetical protein
MTPVPALQIAIPEELESAAAKLREAVAESRKARAILVAANEAVTEARQKLARAAVDLQAAEAGAALGLSTTDTTAARKKWVASRDGLEFALARATGVQARMTVPTGAEEQARERLRLAWRAFALSQIAAYHERYQGAVAQFLDMVDPGIALAVGFAGSGANDPARLQNRLQRVQILGSLEEKEFVREKRAYEKNARAIALRDELIAVRQRLFRAESEKGEINA